MPVVADRPRAVGEVRDGHESRDNLRTREAESRTSAGWRMVAGQRPSEALVDGLRSQIDSLDMSVQRQRLWGVNSVSGLFVPATYTEHMIR